MIDLVANRVPIPIRDAIERRIGRLIVLWEIDHPDGYERGWSGVGKLRFDGYDWRGIGPLVGMDFPQFSRRTAVRVATLTLGGVDPEGLQFVTKKVRGRFARVSLAALRRGTRAVNGDIYPVCVGLCDSQDHTINTDRSASIVVTVNQPINILDRTPNLAWTADWLKARYGADIVGLDDLAGVAARIVSWQPAA